MHNVAMGSFSRAYGIVSLTGLLSLGAGAAVALLGCGGEADGSVPQAICNLDDVRWEPLPAPPDESAFAGRAGHSMHWTGSKVVVWGGLMRNVDDAEEATNTGFFYDPILTTYEPTSMLGAPSGRVDFDDSSSGLNSWSGLWLIWGGRTGVLSEQSTPSTGAILDVVNNQWFPVKGPPDLRVPRGRAYVHIVPRGDRWIVWGGNHAPGEDALSRQSGGRVLTTHFYDASGNAQNLDTTEDDCWSSLDSVGPTCPEDADDLPNELTSRKHGVVHNLGDRMIAWGGAFEHSVFPSDGAIYNYHTSEWTPMSSDGAPAGREYAVSAASQSHVYIFGGAGAHFSAPNADVVLGDGAIYHLQSDTWEPLPTTNAPSPRLGRGFWILQRYFIVVSGASIAWDDVAQQPKLAVIEDAGLFDSQTSKWVRFTPGGGEQVQRFQPNMVWAKDRLILWGGRDLSSGDLMASGYQLVLPDCL